MQPFKSKIKISRSVHGGLQQLPPSSFQEQGQILQYNSISRFGSHLNTKRLATADKRNSLKQKFKTNEKRQSCPETSTANSRLVRVKGGFYEKVCAYNDRRGVNLKFCLADFVHLIQKPSRGHYNFCIFVAHMYAVTPQLLNQINKIRETEL